MYIADCKPVKKFASLCGTNVQIAEDALRLADPDCLYFSSKDRKQQQPESLYISIIAQKHPVSVMEIGTGKGEITAIMAKLMPWASITTYDLPTDDPFYNKLAIRHDNLESLGQFSNVKVVLKNSFFLQEAETGKFDFIYVDGGHRYPFVAWDMLWAYHHIKDNGTILMHDFNNNDTDVASSLFHMSQIIPDYIGLLPFAGYIYNVYIAYLIKNLNKDTR